MKWGAQRHLRKLPHRVKHKGICEHTGKPHTMTAGAYRVLQGIPLRFEDDGCSNWFDKLFKWSIRWCCRIHDFRYCAYAGSSLGQKPADAELRMNIVSAVPDWRTLEIAPWAGWVLSKATRGFNV